MKQNNEQFYNDIASRYTDIYGQQILSELYSLERSGGILPTPTLDAKLKRRMNAKKRKNLVLSLSTLAAACVIMIALLPGIISNQFGGSSSGGIAEGTTSPSHDASASMAAEAPHATSPYEPIPLGVTLTGSFSVSSWEQDKGKTIYYIDNDNNDNVVLSLEHTEDLPKHEGFSEIDINGTTAYASYQADYSVLTFKKEDVTYILTCKHDINTLIELSHMLL